MKAPLYELLDIEQNYGERVVLRVEKLHVGRGEIVGLTGPNGSGKSTLLRLMAFLEQPWRGEVLYDGKAHGKGGGGGTGKGGSQGVGMRRRVSFLGQDPYLLKRTVFANVAYGLKVRGETGIAGRVGVALEAVGLDPDAFARRRWFELSGGEARRVAMAARLAIRPETLLLDEPTASLDRESAERIKAGALQARRDMGTTLVVASHDLEWLTAVSDRVLTLCNGCVLSSGHG